jgi:hypothetical protein
MTDRPAIEPIRQIGDSRRGSLTASFSAIVNVLGAPNATDMDDPSKVAASWGFRDAVDGRKAFVWCYKYDRAEDCGDWSIDGDKSLLRELFGAEAVQS